MPRNGRRSAADAGTKLWHAALYVRLSREDGDKDESDSISNQRALLTAFAQQESDLDVFGVYVDDGYSGTSFQRPDFQRLMADVKRGAVDCVIVKDLSRLGRNYIEVGEYIEKIFPLLEVRFISVGDQLDSVKSPQTMNNLIVPFKNIINDEYCRDISGKVRSSLDLKRRQGKFIGSFAAYGYRKDPADHNHLLVDPEAADVVRSIFAWFLSGMSILGIAKRLNEQGVPNPTAYKRGQGQNCRLGGSDALWPDSSVRRILHNRLYTGCLVQGRSRVRSYKVQKLVAVPEQDWFVVPDTHEAIIPPETFAQVQALLARDTRTAPGESQVYLLSGLMKCADCGRAMHRKVISQPGRSYGYYLCSTFKKLKTGGCTKHSVRTDKVEAAVLETLRKQIDLAVEMDALIRDLRAKGSAATGTTRLRRTLAAKQRERETLERMKLALYPDWKNGDLTREEYLQLRTRFDAQLAENARVTEDLAQELARAEGDGMEDNAFLAAFTKHQGLTHLTRELLVALVEEIRVHEGGALTIRFRFADAFAQAEDFLAESGQALPLGS